MKSTTLLLLLFLCCYSAFSQNVILVIIDGARYSETFGDPEHTYIPEMAKLATEGTIVSHFYNQGHTYTSRAIPAIWCGTWTNTIDTVYNGASTQYTDQPSIFEYYRKQKNVPAEQCEYFIKYVPSLWLPSFNPNYGPDYWPLTVCDGETDSDVLNNAIAKLSENHPELSVVYFADVDHYGHSGIWSDYTGAIETADKAVGQLWEFVQSDSFYKDSTILIVTNDHGRHDDDHGGFRGHGCSCNGCRQIMFLAIGKGIKQNYISEIEYKLTDVAVTIASVLDVDAEHATGEEITDIFETTNICTSEAEALYKMYGSMMKFTRDVNESVTVNIIDMNGIIRHSYHLSSVSEGQELQWNNGNLSLGIYLITINSVSGNQIKKVIVN